MGGRNELRTVTRCRKTGVKRNEIAIIKYIKQ